MAFQVAYNPSLGNALVGISVAFDTVPEGITTAWFDGEIPDLTKFQWSEGGLNFISKGLSRTITQTEFMRRFTFPERLAIRGLEQSGDLVIIDAMALMSGTKDGVNLDDPDVLLTLQYIASKGIIVPIRITEVLA